MNHNNANKNRNHIDRANGQDRKASTRYCLHHLKDRMLTEWHMYSSILPYLPNGLRLRSTLLRVYPFGVGLARNKLGNRKLLRFRNKPQKRAHWASELPANTLVPEAE